MQFYHTAQCHRCRKFERAIGIVCERFADVSVVDRVAHGGGGLWFGQAYVMNNEHRCILLMAF